MLGSVIQAEAESVTFTRHAAGTWASGMYVPGSTSTFSALFAVQPMTDRELQLLPEGERTRAYLKLYGTVELQVASPATGRLGDRFTRDGLLWEVVKESAWQNVTGAHRRYAAAKVEA